MIWNQNMRVLITIVCILTPIMGWIALIFFTDAWSKEDAAKEQLERIQAAGAELSPETSHIVDATSGSNSSAVSAKTLSRGDYVPVDEFAHFKQIDEEKVIQMIRDGFYTGHLFEDKWHVHISEFPPREVRTIRAQRLTKFPAHDKAAYIPIDDFARRKQIDRAKVVQMIKDGFYNGHLFDGEWHVHRSEI